MSVVVDVRRLDRIAGRLRRGGYAIDADEVQRAVTLIVGAAGNVVDLIGPARHARLDCPIPDRGAVLLRPVRRRKVRYAQGSAELESALGELVRDGEVVRRIERVRVYYRHNAADPQERPSCDGRTAAGNPCACRATWRCERHGWLCGFHSYYSHQDRICKRCGSPCVEFWGRRGPMPMHGSAGGSP